MSTKQIVIITLMLMFMAGMLAAMGSWFHSSLELDSKNKAIEALQAKERQLRDQVEGIKDVSGAVIKRGLKEDVLDTQNGLIRKFTDASARATDMIGSPQSGMIQRRTLYEEKVPEIEKKWKTDAQPHWKNTYDDWRKQDEDIKARMENLKKQSSDNEEKLAAAQTELEQAMNDESTERNKTVAERKKMAEEIGKIRQDQEEVLAKVNAVTREVRKLREVVPQGKIIHSAPDLKSVDIDMGSAQGIRNGLRFDVYSSAHAGQVLKGSIEVVDVGASSAHCIVLPPKGDLRVDPATGWSSADPKVRYSIYSASGPDETDAQELQKPKSKTDRVEQMRIEKIEREQGLEAAEAARREMETPSTPPGELGTGFYPIAAGDWISNPDFTPITSDAAFQSQTREELLAMADINIGPLTFYFTDAVRPYRKEFLKRICERNACKTTEAMSSDVNYVVSVQGQLRIDLLEDKLSAYKDKDDQAVTAEVRSQRKTLADLKEGKRIGAQLIAEDELEAFFDRRQRKMELLRGNVIQPGQHTFYVAAQGQTRELSVEHLRRWIHDHGGVVARDLDAKVDYVVVGAALDAPFMEKVRKLGLKVIREDELPWFFGVK